MNIQLNTAGSRHSKHLDAVIEDALERGLRGVSDRLGSLRVSLVQEPMHRGRSSEVTCMLETWAPADGAVSVEASAKNLLDAIETATRQLSRDLGTVNSPGEGSRAA